MKWLVLVLSLAKLSLPSFVSYAVAQDTSPEAARQVADFSGDWQTFWRTGSAVLNLSQNGDQVTGTYQPDNGRILGTVVGRVLSGTWEQTDASGQFVFAVSDDGQILTGRFANGEYWNGFRADTQSGSSAWQLDNQTPRQTLRSILLMINAAIYEGDAGALRRVSSLLSYDGDQVSAGQEARRRALMFELLDMATVRILDAPEGPEREGEPRVGFAIGPSGIPDRVTIEFERDSFGRWRLVLPSERELTAERDRLLAAMGYTKFADLDRARADSPRAVLREFIQGTNTWQDGGRERALAVMDLSAIPERLQPLDGPIFADFLKRIFDRIAYVVWQEIPDNPNRSVPYVYFQHPIGNVSIVRTAEPKAGEEPEARGWKISAETLASSPALLRAMQDLPVIGGLENEEALSPFLQIRERARAFDHRLIADWWLLELWQWLGLVLAIFSAALCFLVLVWVIRGLAGSLSPLQFLGDLAIPFGFLLAAIILDWTIGRIGVTQAGLPLVGSLTGVFLVIAVAFAGFRLAGLAGSWVHAQATKTTSYVDEIASSLGTALVKLLIVGGAIIAAADVVGLPYEGVLAGLGVGGIAIAFAARDTVSNLMGGGLLLADRPFRRGDLIELDGKLATVENVGLRSTRLRALDDTLLHVPNVQLSDRVIANWGRRRRRKVVLVVGVTYDTPREKLDAFTQRMKAMLLSHSQVDPDDVYVGLKDFGASSIDIELLFHLRVADYGSQVDAKHALILDIIAIAEDLAVEFAFPTRTVHMVDSIGTATAELALDNN